MNLHKQSVEVDTAIVLRGLKDALAGGKLLLTDDEARAALTQLQTDLRNKQMEKMKEAADLNKKPLRHCRVRMFANPRSRLSRRGA